jgi:rare lipoprotein A
MKMRLSAAICVAITMVVYSFSAMARPTDQIKPAAGATRSAINGAASTYNPYRPGHRSGGAETASGERYDPATWTAAIQSNLRELFGGVRYGKAYRPAFALVASAEKRVIVKINDVGPLEPGRVIDFTEQTMRYFDPALRRGVIPIVVTPLRGDDWSPGPVKNGCA